MGGNAATRVRTTIIYYSDQGLQRGSDLTFTAAKPGLCYVGEYDLSPATTADNAFAFTAINNWSFSRSTVTDELGALKKIISQYKGTAWEPVIANRIKELSNAK